MNSKERMLAALHGRPVDRVPVAPIYLHLYLAQEVRRQAVTRYQAFIGDRDEIPLEPAQDAAVQAEAIRAAWGSLGETPDWIWTPLLSTIDRSSKFALQQEDGRLWRTHRPSGEREELSALVVKNDAMVSHWERTPPGSRAEVDALVPLPVLEDFLTDVSLLAARQLVEEMGSDTFVAGKMNTPFSHSRSLLGFQGQMTLPYDNPELFHHLLRRLMAFRLAWAQAYAKVGVHGVFVEETLSSADLISPRIYDQFVFPYNRVLLEEFQALGLPTVLYMCGDVVPRLERLVELAPTALAVEESKKGFRIDLAEVAAAVGDRMSLFGNLDAIQIMGWDDEELNRQIRAQVEAAGPARGFVVSMGSPFPLETPRERVAAFIATARELI